MFLTQIFDRPNDITSMFILEIARLIARFLNTALSVILFVTLHHFLIFLQQW